MKILLVGGGAREHALAWKLRRDDPAAELLLAPGNAGSAPLGRSVSVPATDTAGIVQLAREERPGLTIIGPEGPLAAGLADRLRELGLAVFGPGRAAAEVEWSKGWAKAFMRRHGIPSAAFEVFDALPEAERYVRGLAHPPVIKDDALAGGKGVTVSASTDEALAALRDIFARPGARVVIEERLVGWETSAHALVDGRSTRLLPFSCDYKRVADGDEGPNTGGMGAYAPAQVSAELRRRVEEEIVRPAVAGLAAEGRPYRGLLYPGLMITAAGPRVVEFNARFGDPETQVLLPLLASPLAPLLLACASGSLDDLDVRWQAGACCGVVLASPGYPEAPRTVTPPLLPQLGEGQAIFSAGSSGRLLTVSACGDSLAQARERAYATLARIDLPEARYRTDVAAYDRALG
ncbi:MAG: phosphoribosylamine--glycine ligase [Chloroflexota bacterium]